jgi:hypothetical protein
MTPFAPASAMSLQRRVVVNPISCRRRLIAAPWLTALLVISVVAGSISSAAAQVRPFQIRSISFPVLVFADKTGWTSVPAVIQQIKALGANDVKVVISAGVYDTPTDNLPNAAANPNPSDAKILAFLQQLKAAGLQVTVDPFTNIKFDPNGNLLDTVHPQPADFNTWMGAHSAAMVHLAQLAQQAGADRFVVFGDEVQLLTFDPANQAGWLNMIAQIRAVFSGSLTSMAYADGTIFNGGNTHIDLTSRPIIDALDSIGIGWFPMPLTNTRSPTIAQLIAGWRKNVRGVDTVAFMQNVHAKYNKPVWISDAAFHSFSGDNISSSDIYDVRIPLVADQQEQANEYDSLLTVLAQNLGSWFLGISFDSWTRFPLDYEGAPRYLNSAYGENIRGKLAEKVLTDWFTGQRSLSYQGLWWNANESGWGINFAHQGGTIFATWFAFAADGNPQWYTIVAHKTGANVYAGSVSSFTGLPFDTMPYTANANAKTPVGTATITFDDDGKSAIFAYTVNGFTQSKQIVPQQFAPGVPLPTCVWGAQPDLTLATNYQDLWWATNGQESGWGISFTHQGNVIFATWFTYDANGKAWWLFAVATETAVPNVYTGLLKVATGPSFGAEAFDPNAVNRTTVGNATITIIDGSHVTFEYTVNGVTQTKNLTRQVFASPGTVCF